jgi:hypothetical protein
MKEGKQRVKFLIENVVEKGMGKDKQKEHEGSESELSEMDDEDMAALAESMGWEEDVVRFAGLDRPF